MKRDMELVRKILIAIEDYDQPNRPIAIASLLPDSPADQVNHHSVLLYDSGFISGQVRHPNTGSYILVTALTWEGHEFLDAIRNDTVWHKTKEFMKEKGLTLPLEVIKSVAIDLIGKQVGL